MTDVTIDYPAVLADLRAKRERINAAIAGIEEMLGLSVSGVDAGAADQKQEKPAVPATNGLGPGAFLGMTIVDAAKKLLAHRRQSLKTVDILNALKDGGIVLTGGTPLNVVGSVLSRNYNSGGDIVKVSRGEWGLAEWHPRLRRKLGDVKGAADANEEEATDLT